jgi:hypothetical protein
MRDQLDTTLLAAMERAFDKVRASDEPLHIPTLHVRVRISGTDELADELARGIEQELRRQLSTMAATNGGASPALQTGPSGAESGGHTGFAGLTPAGMDGPASETTDSLQFRVRMLLHYLETGALPWPLAQVEPAVAVSELRDTAHIHLAGVLDRLTGEPVLLQARVAFWFRWLQLLPEASWPVLAREAVPPSSGQGVRLAELIGTLSREQAGALSRYARLQLAAAAIDRARRTGDLADAVEFASLVLHVLGGGGAGGPGANATSSSGASARPPGGTDSLVSRPGNDAGELDRASSSNERVVAEAARLSSASESGLVSRSGNDAGELNRASSSNERVVAEAARLSSASESGLVSRSGNDAGELNRAASSNERAVAEAARLSSAIGLTARLPEPVAAALRAWLVAPTSSVEAGATYPGMAGGGPAEPRTGPPLPPGKPLQSRPEPGLAAPATGVRETRRRDTDARTAPFGQMVHHAGLVLLHPFLPRFFESTAIKETGRPALAPDVLPRAAALLHLLAVGNDEVFELELDFIKVLLGLPLDSPLPVSEGLLRASDQEEVEALLSAVIGHWRVLKSTSVKGLRSSFLQRSGLLRETEQGFRLQVTPAPFDMLLGQLPWGIGTIKLPWMKRAIFTEWSAP